MATVKKQTATPDLGELISALPDDVFTSSYSYDSITSPFSTTITSTPYVAPGGPYTVTGSGSYNIGAIGSNTNWSTSTGICSPLSVKGNVEISGSNADISINGVRLGDRLTAIEQQLNILRPNVEIESEWDELRQLGDRYRQLEQEIKEKIEVWKLLKAKHKPTDY